MHLRELSQVLNNVKNLKVLLLPIQVKSEEILSRCITDQTYLLIILKVLDLK